MKIKKTPSKKLIPLPGQLREVIKLLEDGPEEQFPAQAEVLREWCYPRGDFFHWIAVLNRFDTILQRICTDYSLEGIQTRDFDPQTKHIIIAIANISRTLFENCTNRNIYNSYEHLNALLNTADMDVLEAALRFMIRPAQRSSDPRASRTNFIAPQEKITELARGWSFTVDIDALCSDSLEVTDEMTCVKLQFYRTRKNRVDADETEGVSIVTAQLMEEKAKSDIQVFQDLVKQHNIPLEYHFELANRIRIAKHVADPTSRRQLVIIQLISTAIMAHTVSETMAQNRVFIYEPHLVSHLAELVYPEKSIPLDIQTYSLYALDAISRHTPKLNEVLNSFNASANHGALLYVLRQINQQDAVYSQDFLGALFALLGYLLQTPAGGQMFMSAGIIQTMLHIVENPQATHLKIATKVVGLLDIILNGVSNSFTAFCNANGVDILLARIKAEVAFCIDYVETSPQTPEVIHGALAPHERVSLVKTMLKFLLRMMEASGTSDGLRNLIDSTAPGSLKLIMENPKIFGNNVFATAINVVSTFIHHEATSLPILQEHGLPQSMLHTIATYESPNGDVLVAITHAFGALCLNNEGLDMFREAKPLNRLFDLIMAREFLQSPAEVDCVITLGSTIDELIRHHPSLRTDAFKCVSDMIKKVLEVGQADIGKPSDNSHLLQLGKEATGDVEMAGDDSTPKPEEETKTECLLVSFIDLVSRFLEGFFQSQANIREFIKEDFPSVLLDYFALPMLPADFSVSIASDSLGYLFRMMSEVSPLPIVLAIAERVKFSVQFIVDDTRTSGKSMVLEFIDVKEHETEKIKTGNEFLRSMISMHGYVTLLSNICSTTVLTHSKNGATFVNELLSQEDRDNIILLMGQLYRTVVWENVLLRESVPKSWYSLKTTKKSANGQADNPLGISGFDISNPEDTSRADSPDVATSSEPDKGADKTAEKTPDPKDPRIVNIKHFKTFLCEIPPTLMPVFQGWSKVSVSVNRRVLDSAQQRELPFKLAEYITRILMENITWSQVDGDEAPRSCRFDYYASMFSMIYNLVMDDRTKTSNIPLAIVFDRKGGTSLLVEYLDTIWTESEKIKAIPAEERTENGQAELVSRIDASLEPLLAVLLQLGSPKLTESSHTILSITTKDDRDSPNYFEPKEWMAAMHLKLSAIKKHLKSELLHQFPMFILHTYLDCIIQIMNGEGDNKNSRSDISTPSSLPTFPPITPILRVEPNQNGVQTLVDMGFSRAQAEHAMIRCNNQVSLATDFILTHPMPTITTTATLAPQSSDDSQPRAGSNQTTSTEQLPITNDENAASAEANNPTSDRDMDDPPGNDSEFGESNDEMTEVFPTSSLGQRSFLREDMSQRQPSNRGKERIQLTADINELRTLRDELRLEIPAAMLSLIEKREDLVFCARDLLVVLCKDDKNNENAQRIMSTLMDRIDATQQQSMDSIKLCTLIRLMALLLREKTIQPAIHNRSTRMLFMLDMVVKAKDSLTETNSPLPTWLASVLLVIEIFISQTDEPLDAKTDTLEAESSQMNIDSENKPPMGEQAMSADQRTQLLRCCVALLQKAKLSKNDILAVLRIVVLLTKHNACALQFVELGGLQQLFSKPASSLEGSRVQNVYIILILRHVIEDRTALEESMKEIISTWGNVPRPRIADIDTFIRGVAHVALRDSSAFLKVSENLCRLTKYNEHDHNKQIKILASENETTDKADSTAEKDEASSSSSNNLPTEQPRTKSNNSSLVVHHILNELMVTCSSQADVTSEKDDEAQDRKLAYTGFLLQCLAELVSSYNSCKYDIYQYSRRRNSKDAGSGRPRHSIMSVLINDLLPYDAINPTEEESRKQQGLSKWTTSVLVAMCYDSNINEETENSPGKTELTTVRKYVLEGMIRSLKDAIASTDTVSVKYSKYLALADLCFRILNSPPNSGSSLLSAREGPAANIAKIMLDKNFVPVLTSAISDVDVNYPHAKNVLTPMLRPLEQLTKAAVKIDPLSKDEKKEGIHELVPRNEHEDNDAPDLYRNSSLGMFNGSVMEEDDLEELDASEEEEGESFEEEDFEGDTGSDLSEMSEEDDEDDVDQEMDVIMHHHHHHYDDTDMGEAEEDEHYDEESDDHDHDHDDEEDSISGEEIDSDESDDDDDDEGRNITWELEDIDDEDGPILHVRTEIEIDTEDEHNERSHDHRHHASRFEEGQDEDLDTLDQSEFDEGSDDYDEGQDAEFNESILVDEEDLGDQMISDGFAEDDIIFEDVHRPRPRSSFARRHGRAFEHDRSDNQLDMFFSGTDSGDRMAHDDVIDHPLLRDTGTSTSEGDNALSRSRFLPSSSSSARRPRIQPNSNLRAFEDILGHNAVRVLENLIMPTSRGGHGQPTAWVGTIETGHHMRPLVLDGRSRATAQESGGPTREIISLLHEFQPKTTAERWQQEGRMMYGKTMDDKALLLANTLYQSLVPSAQKEKKKREEAEIQRQKEEEERKKAEEIKRKKEEEEEEQQRRAEEERLAAERAAAEQETVETVETTETAETGAEGDEPSTTTEETPAERTTITINGQQVDISGTGIDIEFLEALPDELRAEVVHQHMRERRSSTHTAEEDISPEFLNALPPELREEVMQQESQRERQRHAPLLGNSGSQLLSPAMSRADGGISNPLDSVVRGYRALASGLNADDMSRFSLSRHEIGRRRGLDPSQATGSRKPGSHRDAIQLVDRSQLATLVRLLFIPQTIPKTLLNRLLENLCENSKTRGDLLSLLICILQDGSVDLAAVDKSFAQLSLNPKGQPKPSQKAKSTTQSVAVGENVPNLITQRCLEVLLHVVKTNDQSLSYFLTENDCLAGLKRTSGKKGKGKEKPTVTSKYPLLVLMSLLDRSIYVENTNLMEQLTLLLSTMCRPFPLLVKKYEEKMEARQKLEEEAATRSEDHPNEQASDVIITPVSSKELERSAPQPPAIPDHYLKMVVQVLTSGECSSKAFRSTVGAITHLSALDGALQTITHELMAAATDACQQICKDLDELLVVLQNAMTGTEIQASALSRFSTASSHQAKLLRVLKTIDHMYSRKQSQEKEDHAAPEREKRLLQIYEELNFLPLWKMLGQCLSVIHEKEELINVATVLLPLIESFMVVSKYVTGQGQGQRSSSLGPASPSETAPGTTVDTPGDFFFAFTEDHKKILNVMVRNNPSLMSGSFSLLVHNPKMLEFDNKRNYFVMQLHKRSEPREHYSPLQLNVRRQHVFEDSYQQLQGRQGNEIKYGKLVVRFYNEEGVDAGGVSREWFSVLARQMFDLNYALFITSAADKLTYQPNRSSWANPDHLSFFKFVGRVIGKAIYDGRLLDAYFTRSFYKHILGRSVDYRDVEAVDPAYYKSLVWMLENDITDVIDLTFSMEMDDYGKARTIDLKPNGRNISVTEENKHEYVNLVTAQKLSIAIKDQINAFLEGFHDIIPASLIQIFNEQELELLISGLPDIDIDDWKNNTTYESYTASSPQIQWFWRAVRSFDQEERAKLLQFATGTSKVPLEGFAHLQGSGGVQKFQIHKDFGGDNRLPSAHTCFNQVDLPQYDSYENLRSSLFKAISECSTGFSFV